MSRAECKPPTSSLSHRITGRRWLAVFHNLAAKRISVQDWPHKVRDDVTPLGRTFGVWLCLFTSELTSAVTCSSQSAWLCLLNVHMFALVVSVSDETPYGAFDSSETSSGLGRRLCLKAATFALVQVLFDTSTSYIYIYPSKVELSKY